MTKLNLDWNSFIYLNEQDVNGVIDWSPKTGLSEGVTMLLGTILREIDSGSPLGRFSGGVVAEMADALPSWVEPMVKDLNGFDRIRERSDYLADRLPDEKVIEAFSFIIYGYEKWMSDPAIAIADRWSDGTAERLERVVDAIKVARGQLISK